MVQVLQGLQACCKKSYLNEFCAVAMCKLIRSCSEELVRTKGVQLLELEGGGGWDSCTPHRLYMLLSLNQVWGKVCVCVWCVCVCVCVCVHIKCVCIALCAVCVFIQVLYI